MFSVTLGKLPALVCSSFFLPFSIGEPWDTENLSMFIPGCDFHRLPRVPALPGIPKYWEHPLLSGFNLVLVRIELNATFFCASGAL